MPALSERLLSVPFDFGYALPERDEPRVRRLGKLCLLAPLGEAGLQGLYQEPQVVRLVLEVGQVDLKLRLGDVPLGVEPNVAVLLGLLGGQPFC